MGKLYVVRHADAGHRGTPEHPDEGRALTERGRRQADGLRDQLDELGITRLVASPFVRCVQTLVPLADVLGIVVELDERLAEGTGAAGALALARELRDTSAVLCSHGDVIPETLDALVRRGMHVKTLPDWRKGTVWVLKRNEGRITTATVWPPPS